MKIESINTSALQLVLQATVGPEAAEFVEHLYVLTNDAMHEGYVTGYAEADQAAFKRGFEAAEVDREEAWDNGFEEGINVANSESFGNGYDAGYEAGYLRAENEYGAAEIFYVGRPAMDQAEYIGEVDYALQGDCAAYDEELRRVNAAYEAEFEAYNEYEAFPSQERFRPTANFDTYSRG